MTRDRPSSLNSRNSQPKKVYDGKEVSMTLGEDAF